MEVPQVAGWFGMENPIVRWMISKGSSISGNLHMGISFGGLEDFFTFPYPEDPKYGRFPI